MRFPRRGKVDSYQGKVDVPQLLLGLAFSYDLDNLFQLLAKNHLIHRSYFLSGAHLLFTNNIGIKVLEKVNQLVSDQALLEHDVFERLNEVGELSL